MPTDNTSPEEVLEQALRITDPAERAAYVDRACGSDERLRTEVEALLKAHEEAGSFLESTPVDPQATLDSPGQFESIGTRIGQYKLLSVLGEGGCGIVYLAEQERPVRRRVALKVIKPGMDTKEVIARFEAERQALALLDHPNIAHVYNAGTTQAGRPYFVMEHVEGLPITQYCDREKLSIEERLELFKGVCEGVQHAHQKGIIHRDLKPSNILVYTEGDKAIPKIIDFGVAKATSQQLTSRTLYTEQGQFIGTPEYMSPEQAEMSAHDVDTRSDVYSLGVVLYELLTGTLPFDSATLREGGVDRIRYVIREEEPKTPSTRLTSLGQEATKVAQKRRTEVRTLAKRLHKELEWIPLKAMRKERTRRYRSASELADDIGNYLAGAPLIAGPESTVYRARKFASRHRTQVLATVCIFFFVVLGISGISMYTHSEARRREAERRIFEQARLLAEQKADASLVAAETFYAAGRYGEALEHVAQNMEYVPARLDARILRGRILAELNRVNEAISGLEELAAEYSEEGAVFDLLAILYHELGNESQSAEYRRKANQFPPLTAEAYYLRAITAETLEGNLAMLSQALKLDHQHYRSRKARAMTYYALGDHKNMEREADRMTLLQSQNPAGYALRAVALRQLGQYDEAIACHTQAIELSDSADPVLIEVYNQRRHTRFVNGDYVQALGDAEECVRRQPTEYRYRFHVIAILTVVGRHEEAKEEYEQMLASQPDAKNVFRYWSAKFVFDALGEGRELNLPERRIGGPAFQAMHFANDLYHEYTAAKFRRLLHNAWAKSWSPDGARLAYGRSDQYEYYLETAQALESQVPDKMGIRILDIATGNTWPLVSSGKDPRWSPNGRYIAYTRWPSVYSHEDEEVWIISAEGGTPWRLTRGKAICWSSDSTDIYYLAREDNCVYRKRFDDPIAVVERVWYYPSGGLAISDPAISPDEKRIAYVYDNVLHIFDITTGEVLAHWRLQNSYSGRNFPLIEWAPDSDELSFGNSSGGLWVYDLKTKIAKQVVRGPVFRGLWAADRTRMVFEVRGPFCEIWVAELDPSLPTAEAMGTGRTIGEHYREEVNRIGKAIESDPCEAELFSERAMYYTYLGEEQKALADIEKCTAMSPSTAARTYYVTANSLVFGSASRGDPTVAVHLARMAIEKTPNQWHYYTTLGAAQYYAGMYEDAIVTLRQADRAYAPDAQRSFPVNAAFTTMALHERGRRQEAEAALTNLRPMFTDGKNREQWEYFIQAEQLFAGKGSKAWEAWECTRTRRLNRAMALLADMPEASDDPDLARVESLRQHLAWEYVQRGSAYEQSSRYEDAMTGYKSAIEADQTCASAYNCLAWLQATCPVSGFRSGTKAVENATVACELMDFKNAGYVDTLAAAHAELGDFDAAARWQQKAVDLLTDVERPKYQAAFEAKRRLYEGGQAYHRQRLFARQMVARWTFDKVNDKGVLDSSANGLHGEFRGDAQTTSDAERDTVLRLDGDGDWLECGNDIRFSITDEITVSAWVKVKKFDRNWQTIVAKGDSAWRLARDYDRNTLQFCCGAGSSRLVRGNGAVDDGRWHHAAGVYDGTRMYLYLDGRLDVSASATGSIDANGAPVFIGGNSERSERFWNGLIDDVRIYSYALSPQEVKDLYMGEEPPREKGEDGHR